MMEMQFCSQMLNSHDPLAGQANRKITALEYNVFLRDNSRYLMFKTKMLQNSEIQPA